MKTRAVQSALAVTAGVRDGIAVDVRKPATTWGRGDGDKVFAIEDGPAWPSVSLSMVISEALWPNSQQFQLRGIFAICLAEIAVKLFLQK
jgi:hypothetical protein